METMVCCFSSQTLKSSSFMPMGVQTVTLAHLRFYRRLLPSKAPLLFECAAIKILPRNIPSYRKKETE